MDMRRFGLSDEDLRQLGYRVGSAPDESDGSTQVGTTPAAPPRRPASPALRIWLATVLLLPVVGWASGLGRRLPAPAPPTAPDTSFSSARALAQLVEVAQQAHPTGSPDLGRVTALLLGRLSALGLQPEVQVATSFVRDSATVTAATVRNVVARIPGTSSTGALALLAHYDAAPLSPGAGDNGIGVAIVLETVRALVAAGPLRNDLVVVLTDADELGGLGTKAFLEQHPWSAEVALVLAVDSRGSTGPALLLESMPVNGALVTALAAADVHQTAWSLARALEGAAPEETATPEVTFTVLGGRAWTRQRRDTRERVSERTLQHGGMQLTALTKTLAGRDLRRELAGPERGYLSLPALGLIHFPRSWLLFGSLGLLAAWGAIGGVIRLRRGTRNGVLSGLGVGLAAVGVSAAAAWALFGLLKDLHPEHGFLQTALYRDGPHVLALAALALGMTSTLWAVARRWYRVDEILFGALAVPLGTALWLTFAAPAAAPALHLSLAGALLGTALLTALGPRRAASAWTWSVVLLLSAATLVVTVPALELVARAWTLERAGTLGALFGLGTLVVLPLMEWLQRPRVWATPLVSVASAGILVGLNLPAVQGAVDHPEQTTLVYLADEPAITDPTLAASIRGASDTTRTRTMIGSWLTVPGPGEAWARSWVGAPATGSTDADVLLTGADDRYEIAGTGPDSELAPPLATVVSTASAGGRREVVVDIQPGIRGEMTGIHIPEGVVAEITGIGDATWTGGATPVRSLLHWGTPEGGSVRVGLSLPSATSEARFLVIEHYLRPRDILGVYFFQRADSLIANAAMGSDRVIQRTPVTLPIPGESVPLPDAPSSP